MITWTDPPEPGLCMLSQVRSAPRLLLDFSLFTAVVLVWPWLRFGRSLLPPGREKRA